VVPAGATVAVVFLNRGANAAFTYREVEPLSDFGPRGHHSPTVVAVIDPEGFNPYHYDFKGDEHPWNKDADPGNTIDFNSDPATYIDGYPGATPIDIDLPNNPTDDIAGRHDADSAAWSGFQGSDGATQRMYRFPKTKIVGALRFGTKFYDPSDSHGTRSAATAVGNIHGTCPECLVVLIEASNPTEAIRWVARQRWIDVVSNSYENNWYSKNSSVRTGIWPGGEAATTQAAVEAGQSFVWAAGNGNVPVTMDVPGAQTTYLSSQKGPDWIVTVGGTNFEGQHQAGSARPVDISAISKAYPSTGGTTAAGSGLHSGTSNAAPMVAGAIAEVIQNGRDLLGDDVGGSRPGGVVASGDPIPCGAAYPECPLGDGKLTRAEAEATVFGNVLPETPHAPQSRPETFVVNSDPHMPGATVATTPFAYAYVGHGVLYGRADPTRFELVRRRLRDSLRGDVAPYPRPAGERNWMIVDSKCRQHIWGEWGGGYFTGTAPDLHPVADALALAWDQWCTAVPKGTLQTLPHPPL
jgi:hypothetical protein